MAWWGTKAFSATCKADQDQETRAEQRHRARLWGEANLKGGREDPAACGPYCGDPQKVVLCQRAFEGMSGADRQGVTDVTIGN